MAAWTPERREKLRRLATKGGLSGKEIASVLGSSRSAIMRELRLMGIRLNGGNHGFRVKKKEA